MPNVFDESVPPQFTQRELEVGVASLSHAVAKDLHELYTRVAALEAEVARLRSNQTKATFAAKTGLRKLGIDT